MSSAVVVGYSRYLDLLPEALLEGKKLVRSGMRNEIARCNAAMDAVLSGENTALVSSGDPGIYALAGLVYELAGKRKLSPADLSVLVFPGIPALCAAAALLGAPLAHDFAVISLSDLLTDWGTIEKRITHALAADFTLVIYNPRSPERDWQLNKLLELSIAARGEKGYIGLVRNAYREKEQVAILTLGGFNPALADMLSILIVGNSETRVWGGESGQTGQDWLKGARMYAPRGYFKKYPG
jgi:precorrin-3B C17-methyltransferase/cobalt-precorrin 5A hydrolase/precorrin-3B C17-methyltransferase